MTAYRDMDIDELRNIKNKYKLAENLSIWATIFVGIVGPTYANYIPFCIYIYNSYKTSKINKGIHDNHIYDRLNEIYNEVISDIIKLSHELENEHILEHYELLNYIYNHNYMNMDMKKNEVLKNCDEEKIIKSLCLNGHGVCRHTSLMCKDYLQKLGFQSDVIFGESRLNPILYKCYLLGGIMSNEKNIKRAMNDPDYIANIMKIIDEEIEDKPKKNPLLIKLIGNHAICKTNDIKYTYYLDITNDTIYIPTPKNKVLIGDRATEFVIKHENDLLSKALYQTKKVPTKKIEYISVMQTILEKEDIKLEDNLDMLEQFNKNNTEKLIDAEPIYQKILTYFN